MRKEKAKYNKAILPEHQGNPLIEALTPKASKVKVMESFGHYPELDEEIRKHLDPLVREEYTVRLKALRQPLPLYYDCFRAIEVAIKTGYSAKNPLSPTTAQYLHYTVADRPEIEPHTGYFEPKGDGITLVGESGVGKSCMLEQVLNYFPNIIEHDSYQGQAMEHRHQVVWIKVDCPNNSSVRDLCEEILASLDLTLSNEKTKPEGTIGKLTRQIEQKIKSSFLGLLVIDEMQRLVFRRTGGENNLLNFLHSLMNKLGVPIFFCANPPFNQTLSRTLKAARRAESAGYFEMEALRRGSQSWEYFINELWDLHWTNVSTELSDELNDKLFELSVGNLDMAHRIYRDAQRLVIGSGDERITTAVLEQAHISSCGLSSKTEEVRKLRKENTLPRRNQKADTPNSSVKIDQTKVDKKIIGDITRPQHPEFEYQLRELQNAIDLPVRIVDPDLLRRAVEVKNPLKYFKDNNLLCDDPLEQFK
ncbi:ATP-binding protein [Colwellia sp. Bg11-28]|uniref:ATP-binding protein n=1 Tax=Colwellia sp. Bg11-28 TaxID=2058305 RepID=UPI000C33000E|nr:ATP-binding protein [Colwellia sp. Bg11-28]PKH88312.1 ATP-binding protein [Colwellia sp. Bg11-28]